MITIGDSPSISNIVYSDDDDDQHSHSDDDDDDQHSHSDDDDDQFEEKIIFFSGEQGVRREAEQGPVAECLHRGKDSQFLVSQENIQDDNRE